MNKNKRRLYEPGINLLLVILLLFSIATLVLGKYILAGIEAGVTLLVFIYSLISKRRTERQLEAYIEEVTYNTENAKNNTLMNFPLPISVFQLEDSKIVWGNEEFFLMCGNKGTRVNAKISDLVPNFSAKWLMEGQKSYSELLRLNDRVYRVHGNIIRSDENKGGFMGLTYWVDVTDYESIKTEYLESRPVAAMVIIDNLDELQKNQAERVKNEIRDAIEDRLSAWADRYDAIVKRYERDRYLVMLEKRYLNEIKEDKFHLLEAVHEVESPNGVTASISIGFGVDAATFAECMQFAALAAELALSRGGDQAVIKNRLNYEFFGGRGNEIEKRNKIRSRVMANTLCELICESSKVYVMGHRFSDNDSIGAAVGVCCAARKCGVPAQIIADTEKTAAGMLIERLRSDENYQKCFINAEDALINADGRTLLVIVDTNNPDTVEDKILLESCRRVAIIDHHRVGANYINNAGFVFIEPYASSTCELMTEILEELLRENADVTEVEADAILAGIMLDTKNFALRTGDRTFDAASWLKRNGGDTTRVKKMMQTGLEDTVAKYRILQKAEMYRQIVIACPEEQHSRVVAAQAADELLNISGVEASVVMLLDGKGGINASARSIGEMNVQILMEKLGGGGNRGVAACHIEDCDMATALDRLRAAIDDYYGVEPETAEEGVKE